MNMLDARNEIDRIDGEILSLFARRMEIGSVIGKIKQAEGLPIENNEREREILLKRYRPQRTIDLQGITHVQNGVQNDYLIKEKKLFADANAKNDVIWNSSFSLPPYPEYDFVLPAVKRAGGLVFIAHPKGYFREKDLYRMDELREMLDFDGIE